MNIKKNVEENCISHKSTLLDALASLEKAIPKVIFIIDDEGKMLASVTDGDVRRAILSGIKPEEGVMSFAKMNPISICSDATPDMYKEVEGLFEKYKIRALPVVDPDGRITEIIIQDKPQKKRGNLNIPVVVMAGGKGTRLYPYTKILPKPLIPIDDIPISERIMNSLYDEGCREFHMIVNYKKNMIKSYFKENELEYDVLFHEEDTPLGTGGGLKLVEGDIDNTFILTNCDILILEDKSDIVKHHIESGNKATMVCSLVNYEIPYGVVHFTDGGEVDTFEEKPSMSFYTNTGYYVLEKEVFDYIGIHESIGMPDVLDRMKNAGLKVGVYPINEGSWLDMGQFDSMEAMERQLREIDNI